MGKSKMGFSTKNLTIKAYTGDDFARVQKMSTFTLEGYIYKKRIHDLLWRENINMKKL